MSLRKKWRPGDQFLIRHMDRSIIVVDKRAGLLSQRNLADDGPNLKSLLSEFVAMRRPSVIYPVHRLDRVVSGLMVYARSRAAQEMLIEQFAAHTARRVYVAAVTGCLPEDTGCFDRPLNIDDPSLRVFAASPGTPGAKPAITHFRVLERFERSKTTLVEVRLETGLRNQIRVHFADAGFPLLGERKYGTPPRAQGRSRIFLHAAELAFRHPATGAEVSFRAPLPTDLGIWKNHLIAGRRGRPGAGAARSAAKGPTRSPRRRTGRPSSRRA